MEDQSPFNMQQYVTNCSITEQIWHKKRKNVPNGGAIGIKSAKMCQIVTP